MKKLLYITANPKPENISTSKTAGRQFVNRLLAKDPDITVEELDLYNSDIPELNNTIFKDRGAPASGAEYDALSEQDKKKVDRINALCSQFLGADIYVIAAPMWSTSYPSRLKQYVDCIIINDRVIKVTPGDAKGLLDDKDRYMIYIQSSGGVYPRIFSSKFNHGVEYFHDVFKFLGIKKFEKVLIEGVDDPSVGKDEALRRAYTDIELIVDKISGKVLQKA